MFVTTCPPTHEAVSIARSLLHPCESWDILNFDSSVFSLNWAFRFIKAGRGTQQSSLKHAWFNYFTQVCPGPWRFSSWRRLKLELKAGGGVCGGCKRGKGVEGECGRGWWIYCKCSPVFLCVGEWNRNLRRLVWSIRAHLRVRVHGSHSVWRHAHTSIGHD